MNDARIKWLDGELEDLANRYRTEFSDNNDFEYHLILCGVFLRKYLEIKITIEKILMLTSNEKKQSAFKLFLKSIYDETKTRMNWRH